MNYRFSRLSLQPLSVAPTDYDSAMSSQVDLRVATDVNAVVSKIKTNLGEVGLLVLGRGELVMIDKRG